MTELFSEKDEPTRLAWVAGVGASAGLGAALARRFARGGLTVIVTGRSPERLDALVEEIRGAGGHAVALPGDVTSESDLAAIAQQLTRFGTLEVAIFNASGATSVPTLELSAEQFEAAWRVSTPGGFLFARESLPRLLASDRGSLLLRVRPHPRVAARRLRRSHPPKLVCARSRKASHASSARRISTLRMWWSTVASTASACALWRRSELRSAVRAAC
ncbi:NAD(P)-dependent dehydrogenase (short-subunit alcohol dehydrogenase family) [Paraburkholderia sp. GAS334]